MRWPTPLTPIIIAKLIGGGGGGSVTAAAVLSAMEAMSDAQAQDKTLATAAVTLTLSGKALTVETDLGNGVKRAETLSKNRRSYVLTTVSENRTETLICDITLRAGGEMPARKP